MKITTVKYSITPEYITLGIPLSNTECPLALSLGSGTEVYCSCVATDTGVAWLTKKLSKWIDRFDNSEPVKPISGILKFKKYK